ncbi:MAG: cupin domain-containing protein [Candidatus Bathyarchaeia archaeon]
MNHFHYNEVENEEVPSPAEGVKVRWLIDEGTGAPNFAMRMFEVEPGGSTPYHTHDWEHEVFILQGEGFAVREDGTEDPVKPWDVVYVEPNERHCFRNEGEETLRFLCLIPLME